MGWGNHVAPPPAALATQYNKMVNAVVGIKMDFLNVSGSSPNNVNL